MAQVKFRFAPAKERSVESRQEAKELGETGEQMAARYLEEQGCVILERHYRKDHKEVDIIALDHGELAGPFRRRAGRRPPQAAEHHPRGQQLHAPLPPHRTLALRHHRHRRQRRQRRNPPHQKRLQRIQLLTTRRPSVFNATNSSKLDIYTTAKHPSRAVKIQAG